MGQRGLNKKNLDFKINQQKTYRLESNHGMIFIDQQMYYMLA